MVTNQQLGFLQEKITELGSAIFFNLSDAVLKLPSTIVQTLKVDDYGFVWFYIKKPKQNLREFDNEFPVRLDFFKKGAYYFLQVVGKGFVVSDPEEMNTMLDVPDATKQVNTKEMVLVKVKIMKADYHETRTSQKTSWWQHTVNSISSFFRGSDHQYRPDSTYLPAS